MLQINLLPEGARKAMLSPVEHFHRTPLMWLSMALVIGFTCSLFIRISLRRGTLRGLNNKIHLLEPKKSALDELQQRLQQLRAQEAAFHGLRHAQGLWSKRLNTLSDMTPEGVWFTELSLDQKKGLIIQGSAIGQGGGGEMVNVGHLVQDLKANLDFSLAIKDIQIESIKRIQEKDVEIVQFTLSCPLREAASSP